MMSTRDTERPKLGDRVPQKFVAAYGRASEFTSGCVAGNSSSLLGSGFSRSNSTQSIFNIGFPECEKQDVNRIFTSALITA
jgi:hypothetical protein